LAASPVRPLKTVNDRPQHSVPSLASFPRRRTGKARRAASVQVAGFESEPRPISGYPTIQAYFRNHQPPTLIVLGTNDKIFPAGG